MDIEKMMNRISGANMNLSDIIRLTHIVSYSTLHKLTILTILVPCRFVYLFLSN